MRFYFGVFQRMRLKTVLKFVIGILFLILATLGLDKVNAETITESLNFTDNAYRGYYENIIKASETLQSYTISTLDKRTKNFGTNNNPYSKNIVSLTDQSYNPNNSYGYLYTNKTYNYNNTVALQHFMYGYYMYDYGNSLNHNNICPNSNSVNMTISFGLQLTDDYAINTYNLNVNNLGEVFAINVEAISTDDVNYSTHCEYRSGGDTTVTNGTYKTIFGLWDCTGVFRGNNSIEIDKYRFNIVNKIEWDGEPLQVPSNNSGYAYFYNYSFINDTDSSFTCSDDSPVVDGGLPTDEGANTVYDNTVDYWLNTPFGGLDTDNIFLAYPTTFQDLLLMPLAVLNSIAEASEYQCVDYQINLSSISSAFGGGNYILRLPCMRETLSDTLGSLYTLIDVLLCAIVFYNVAMNLIQLIEAITSGEDLYTYFFARTDQNYNTGYGHYNKKTGEVVD